MIKFSTTYTVAEKLAEFLVSHCLKRLNRIA